MEFAGCHGVVVEDFEMWRCVAGFVRNVEKN